MKDLERILLYHGEKLSPSSDLLSFIGGMIFGLLIGTATGRELLKKAIGLTEEEIRRRLKK